MTEANITEWICFMSLCLQGSAGTDKSHVVWTEKPPSWFSFGCTSAGDAAGHRLALYTSSHDSVSFPFITWPWYRKLYHKEWSCKSADRFRDGQQGELRAELLGSRSLQESGIMKPDLQKMEQPKILSPNEPKKPGPGVWLSYSWCVGVLDGLQAQLSPLYIRPH